MRKWIIGVVVAAAAVALVAGGAAFAAYRASAPEEVPPAVWEPLGRIVSGYRGDAESLGSLHEYMMDAFAEALGLTHEDLEARLADVETLASIAQDQGFTAGELATLWKDARQKALDAAVADGVLTQEQADWMLEHMAWCGPFAEIRAWGFRKPFDFGSGGGMGPRRLR